MPQCTPTQHNKVKIFLRKGSKETYLAGTCPAAKYIRLEEFDWVLYLVGCKKLQKSNFERVVEDKRI
jgi:hypothetical protein